MIITAEQNKSISFSKTEKKVYQISKKYNKPIDNLIFCVYNKSVSNETLLRYRNSKREVLMEKTKLAYAIDTLKKSSLFRGCDEAVFASHINEESCNISHYEPSSHIYEPKSYKKCIGFVLSGKVVVHSSDASRQVLLRTFEAGEMFGVAALFANDVDFATNISAKTECDVLFIGDTVIYSLIENDSSVRRNYLTFLSEKIRFLNRKITFFTAGSAERKLSLYLLGLPREESKVKLSISMSALSDMMDLGRASLYRAFDRLCEDGFILRDGKTVILLDPDKMREYYN